MPKTVIVGYRPRAGKAEALDALCATHFARLYAQGLVTRRLPFLMRAEDGTLLEVFEWKSERAIEEAHSNHAVVTMWGEFAAVSDYVPVGTLREAGELFSGFESANIDVVRPAFLDVYNHVQVNEHLSTSGAIRVGTLDQMAAAGYGQLIDLLPADNRYALANEAELARDRGLTYHGIPVDFAAPSREDYARFEAILDALDESEKVYVHCAANMRVTAFVALYGQRRLGWSPARAEELLAEVWQPNAVWRAFLDELAP